MCGRRLEGNHYCRGCPGATGESVARSAYRARLACREGRSGQIQIAPDTPTLAESVSHALEHCFERQSVRKAHDVWEEAIRHGRGAGIDIKALRAEFDRLASGSQSRLVALGDELTTTLHLERERALVAAIETGKDMVLPASGRFIPSSRLNSEQRDAVAGLVGSCDRWNALIGDAGTGKTFAASELVRAYI